MDYNYFDEHELLVPRTFTRDKTELETQLDDTVSSEQIKTFPSELFNPHKNPENAVYRASNIIQINNEPTYWFLKITDEEWPGEQVHKHIAAAKLYDKHVTPDGTTTIPLVIQTENPYNTHLSVKHFMGLLETDISCTSPSPPEIDPIEDTVELTHVVDERYREHNVQRRDSEREIEEFVRSINQMHSREIEHMVTRVENILENPQQWLEEIDTNQIEPLLTMSVDERERLLNRLQQPEPIGTAYQPALEIAFRTTVGDKMSENGFWSFFIAHRLLMEHGNEYNENMLLTTFQRRNSRGENIIEQITTVPSVEPRDTVFYNTTTNDFIQVDGYVSMNGHETLLNVTDPFTRAEWECLDDYHPASLEHAAPLCRTATDSSPFIIHVSTSNTAPLVVHKSVFDLLLSF